MANIEIIVGTYEEFLLGYKVERKGDKHFLIQSFADKSHTGALKCLAVQGKWIATGATDDRIFIYDMKTRKQSQILLSHEGTINALDFTVDETHLLSGGGDGKMIATNLENWKAEGYWEKAHKGSAVTNISCHPSGKLALSLGADLVLRSWNLIKGRVAYKTNLKSRANLRPSPDCLLWSKNGKLFSMTGPRVVEIWSIETGDILKSHKTQSKPVCVTWIDEETCLVGLEDGKVLWVDIKDEADQQPNLLEAHNSRVKVMSSFSDYLVTASSSGDIKLWQMDRVKRHISELALINIGCRPTCLGVLDLDQFGPDYILTRTIIEMHDKPVKQTKQTPKSKPRGVVTIEYDDNEDGEDDVEDEEDDKAPGKSKSKAKKKKKANQDSDDSANESEDEDDDYNDDDDEDDDDDDLDNFNEDDDDDDDDDDEIDSDESVEDDRDEEKFEPIAGKQKKRQNKQEKSEIASKKSKPNTTVQEKHKQKPLKLKNNKQKLNNK